jgi:tRNA(fMet)-specific endonuclease VapC
MLDAFFSTIATLPFDEAAAKAAATIRAGLKKKERPIGAYDALIAGTALARGLVVVTSNAAEFKRVNGLQVKNWR